jgi:hypothetical protein
MVQFYAGNEFAAQAIEHLAETHSRQHHDIPPRFYEIWVTIQVGVRAATPCLPGRSFMTF